MASNRVGVRAAGYPRLVPPAATVARVAPHFHSLGITRVAEQTKLDRLEIPSYAAFRPNARSLSVNQGKGITPDAAKASAVMEAVEFAFAERPSVPIIKGSLSQVGLEWPTLLPRRQLPSGFRLDPDTELDWVEGEDLVSLEPLIFPLDALCIDSTRKPAIPVGRSTNGCASGNDRDEAIVHALCELIERDAHTLFRMISRDDQLARCVSDRSLESDEVAILSHKVEMAGASLVVFDLTSDIDVPVFLAIIYGDNNQFGHFSATAGCGCHPVAWIAAARAITEASQTRVTHIAGSRDDVQPQEFKLGLDAELIPLLDAVPNKRRRAHRPVDQYPLGAYRTYLTEKLAEAGVGQIGVFDLGGSELGINVVKLISERLEDRAPNRNWRPGARALKSAMRQR